MDVDQKQCDLCDLVGPSGTARPKGWEVNFYVSTSKARSAEVRTLDVDLCPACRKKPISALIAYVKKCGHVQT